jgi:hypothetical protein
MDRCSRAACSLVSLAVGRCLSAAETWAVHCGAAQPSTRCSVWCALAVTATLLGAPADGGTDCLQVWKVLQGEYEITHRVNALERKVRGLLQCSAHLPCPVCLDGVVLGAPAPAGRRQPTVWHGRCHTLRAAHAAVRAIAHPGTALLCARANYAHVTAWYLVVLVPVQCCSCASAWHSDPSTPRAQLHT